MENNYLTHHGIKGQRWGVRRFQNEDGSLTNAGKKKQARIEKKEAGKQQRKELHKLNKTGKKSLFMPSGESVGDARMRHELRVRRAQKFMNKKGMSAVDALKASRVREAQLYVGTAVTSVTLGALGIYVASKGA